MKIEVWTPPEERKEEPVLRLRLRESNDNEKVPTLIYVDEYGNERGVILFVTAKGIALAAGSNRCGLPSEGSYVKTIK